jgi:hypothetical protein
LFYKGSLGKRKCGDVSECHGGTTMEIGFWIKGISLCVTFLEILLLVVLKMFFNKDIEMS